MTRIPSSTPRPSFIDRLKRLLGAHPPDGSLRVSVTAPQALELVAQGAALVDVREATEWRSGHAPQALHIPLGELGRRTGTLPSDRPVVVVCASGMRSRSGARLLRGLGYQATSLTGGMAAWQRAGGGLTR